MTTCKTNSFEVKHSIEKFSIIYVDKATKVTYGVLLSFTGIHGWASLQSDENLNINYA